MVYISGSDEKRRIAENDKEKLCEEIKAKTKELGLQKLKPLRGQSEYQQLEDMKTNREKILEEMQEAKETRIARDKRKKEDEREKRMKNAEKRYLKKKEIEAKMAYEKRKISL